MATRKKKTEDDPKGQADAPEQDPEADRDTKGQDRDTDGQEPEKDRDTKGQKSRKSEPLLCEFFGPECTAEISDDGTMTRGAETYAAVGIKDQHPEGQWHEMAATPTAKLLLKKK